MAKSDVGRAAKARQAGTVTSPTAHAPLSTPPPPLSDLAPPEADRFYADSL